MSRKPGILFLIFLCVAMTGCDLSMRDQPRYDPYEESRFFQDNRASRPLVEGVVARGGLKEDEHFYTGKTENRHVDSFPFEITEEVLQRGQERYNIYCIVCHDALGYGNGMVVRRGFKQPQSFHSDRLREAPPGYFFDIITHGFGAMYDYAAQIKPADRWAVAAYIKTLQFSQNIPADRLPEDIQHQLAEKKQPDPASAGTATA